MPTQSDQGIADIQQQQPPVIVSPHMVGGAKEVESPNYSEAQIEEVKEFEIPKEVAGHIEKAVEHIEIPPDLKQIGLSHPSPQTPVTLPTQSGPTLPLSDDQIGTGLQTDVTTSLRWLAEWCLKQLKAMHFHIKRVGQHFMRVKDM